jgi:hypothetical protein
MAINRILDGVKQQVVGVATAAVAQKVSEGANKLISTVGGWNGFSKLTAFSKNKDATAAEFLMETKKLEAQGLSPQEIQERLAKMDPATVGRQDLDKLQSDVNSLNVEANDITASQQKALLGIGADDDLVNHKVKLIEKGVAAVVFDIMPEVVESRTVEYEAIAPPQNPSAFQKYKGTSSTQWTVNATLTCRNSTEATNNLRILNLLRGWTMPFYGERTRESYPNKLGAPPPVLEFSGWRNQMVGPVQVVITSLNWNFPQDVDYIAATGFTKSTNDSKELIPFPTVIKIAIQLVESFSTDQLNGFDLAAFRTGRMDQAFAQLVTDEASTGKRTTGLVVGTASVGEEAQTVPGAPVEAAAAPGVSEATEAAGAVTPAAPATPAAETAPPAEKPVDNAPLPESAFPPPPALSSGQVIPPLRGNTRQEQIQDAERRIQEGKRVQQIAQDLYNDSIALANELEAAGNSTGAKEARSTAQSALTGSQNLERLNQYREAQIRQLQAAGGGG